LTHIVTLFNMLICSACYWFYSTDEMYRSLISVPIESAYATSY